MNFDEAILLRVLELFVNRPDTLRTADSIASSLQRDISAIEPVLEFLVRTEVLKTSSYEEPKAYQFIPSLQESEKEDIQGNQDRSK